LSYFSTELINQKILQDVRYRENDMSGWMEGRKEGRKEGREKGRAVAERDLSNNRM